MAGAGTDGSDIVYCSDGGGLYTITIVVLGPICLWSVGGDVQRRSEVAILRVCRYEGSLRQGTKRGGVALHGEG